MTANPCRPKMTWPTIILPPETEGVDHPPRPYYCCWYRIVFDQPEKSAGSSAKPPAARPE